MSSSGDRARAEATEESAVLIRLELEITSSCSSAELATAAAAGRAEDVLSSQCTPSMLPIVPEATCFRSGAQSRSSSFADLRNRGDKFTRRRQQQQQWCKGQIAAGARTAGWGTGGRETS